MALSFEHVDVITVKAPDGRLFDVRIVRADGRRPLPRALMTGKIVVVTLPLYALYRGGLAAWYRLSRASRCAVEVVDWVDRTRPQHRRETPDRASATTVAGAWRNALERGDPPQ